MKRNALVMLSLLFLLMALGLGGCSREMRVGVIDIQRIIEEAPLAQKLQERLDIAGEEIESRFKQETADISEEERMLKQQQAYQDYLVVKQELEEELNETIEEAVQAVAEEERLTIIFYKQAVRYGGMDVTERVIEKLK